MAKLLVLLLKILRVGLAFCRIRFSVLFLVFDHLRFEFDCLWMKGFVFNEHYTQSRSLSLTHSLSLSLSLA